MQCVHAYVKLLFSTYINSRRFPMEVANTTEPYLLRSLHTPSASSTFIHPGIHAHTHVIPAELDRGVLILRHLGSILLQITERERGEKSMLGS